MSKVQGKDTDLLNNLTSAGIASELDSHLRDLEKNIAVAREFIKLADESYSELRHKWNLIQEEAHNKTGTGLSESATSSSKKRPPRSQQNELTTTEDNAVSKTDEIVSVAFEKTPKPEKSKSRSKHEKALKHSEGPKETPYSPAQLESVKPSRDHGSKRRKRQSTF